MPKSEDKGKRPARRMGLLIAFLIIGAIVVIALWMREPPPGVKPTGALSSQPSLVAAPPTAAPLLWQEAG
jgi:hypothetical protein